MRQEDEIMSGRARRMMIGVEVEHSGRPCGKDV